MSVTFLYLLFGIGIARSWELLGLEGGGPLDLLSRRLGSRQPLAGARPRRIRLRAGSDQNSFARPAHARVA